MNLSLSFLLPKAAMLVCILLPVTITYAGEGITYRYDTIPFTGQQPVLQFKGAFIHYNFNYRSNLDTPFLQRNLLQHSVTGNADFIIAGIPVRAWWLARKSNSAYFRDIYDARIEFDGRAFKDKFLGRYREELNKQLEQLKDSLTAKLYASKEAECNSLKAWLNNPLTEQRLVEMNEVLKIPAVTYNVTLPDSLARKQSDSLRQQAREFMAMYERRKQQYNSLRSTADSLKTEYYRRAKQAERLRNVLKGNFNSWRDYKKWKDSLSAYAGEKLSMPRRYEWLMGLRNFGIGKNPVNYSELTAKNISVNGINIEFNSWYYFSVTAGLVDFRFRDFSLSRFSHSPQYLVMVRAGIGELHRNYVILSLLKGQKQLYRSGDNGPVSYPVTTIAIEAKYQLHKNTSITAEASQSQSPSFQQAPVQKSKLWDLSDKTNKALSVKLHSYLPVMGTRLEAMYKYTGANYQSFNSFQSNAGLYAWYIKADQHLFKKQLRISASARSNEFFNPYIVQAYKSNTVFKSIQGSFKKRKWPAVTVGYLPVTQLTKIDNQVYENRFHAFNASLNHVYKLGTQQASTVVFTRFYNGQTDSSFVLFNASSFLFTQNMFFTNFTALIGISQTRNSNYLLNTLEGLLDIPINKSTNLGIGSKLNSLNNRQAVVGYSGKLNTRFRGRDVLFLHYEKGYLPGQKDELVRNDLLTAGFIKYFN